MYIGVPPQRLCMRETNHLRANRRIGAEARDAG
jgi:hypothetical protein